MEQKSAFLADQANQRFAWLLEERGFDFWTEENLELKIPVLGTRPDFYVETKDFGPFIAEVESFEEASPWPTQSFGQFDPEVFTRRLRTSIKHAARQLKPYDVLGIPMIVILDNWRLVGIPSNIGSLRQALYGVFEFRMQFDPAKATFDQPRLHHGAGQTLHPARKRYVSGVAWNLPKREFLYAEPETKLLMRVRMIHNDFASRLFPVGVFSDEEDEHWAYDANGRWSSLKKSLIEND